MRVIRNSQNRKHGSAVHLLQLERRIPSTTVAHTGAVCTTCRTIPWETTPTTYRAITSSRAHHASIRLSGYVTSRLAATVANGDESPFDSARYSNPSNDCREIGLRVSYGCQRRTNGASLRERLFSTITIWSLFFQRGVFWCEHAAYPVLGNLFLIVLRAGHSGLGFDPQGRLSTEERRREFDSVIAALERGDIHEISDVINRHGNPFALGGLRLLPPTHYAKSRSAQKLGLRAAGTRQAIASRL